MYHGILFSSTKVQTSDTGNNLDESPGNCVKWKKTIPNVIYCNDSIHVTFLTRQIFRNADKRLLGDRDGSGGASNEFHVVIKGKPEISLW